MVTPEIMRDDGSMSVQADGSGLYVTIDSRSLPDYASYSSSGDRRVMPLIRDSSQTGLRIHVMYTLAYAVDSGRYSFSR